jgi:type III secretion system YscI/HrpB-like protein
MVSSFEVAQLATQQPAVATDALPKTAPSDDQVDTFEQIFRDANARSSTTPTTSSEPVTAAESQDSRQNTIDTLGLDAKAAPTSTTGDTILGGLSKLREIFDVQQAKLAGIGYTDSASGLIAAQLEVVKYSMLVDVTSKLTGKATQSFDTLMKGQ